MKRVLFFIFGIALLFGCEQAVIKEKQRSTPPAPAAPPPVEPTPAPTVKQCVPDVRIHQGSNGGLVQGAIKEDYLYWAGTRSAVECLSNTNKQMSIAGNVQEAPAGYQVIRVDEPDGQRYYILKTVNGNPVCIIDTTGACDRLLTALAGYDVDDLPEEVSTGLGGTTTRPTPPTDTGDNTPTPTNPVSPGPGSNFGYRESTKEYTATVDIPFNEQVPAPGGDIPEGDTIIYRFHPEPPTWWISITETGLLQGTPVAACTGTFDVEAIHVTPNPPDVPLFDYNRHEADYLTVTVVVSNGTEDCSTATVEDDTDDETETTFYFQESKKVYNLIPRESFDEVLPAVVGETEDTTYTLGLFSRGTLLRNRLFQEETRRFTGTAIRQVHRALSCAAYTAVDDDNTASMQICFRIRQELPADDMFPVWIGGRLRPPSESRSPTETGAVTFYVTWRSSHNYNWYPFYLYNITVPTINIADNIGDGCSLTGSITPVFRGTRGHPAGPRQTKLNLACSGSYSPTTWYNYFHHEDTGMGDLLIPEQRWLCTTVYSYNEAHQPESNTSCVKKK